MRERAKSERVAKGRVELKGVRVKERRKGRGRGEREMMVDEKQNNPTPFPLFKSFRQ